MPFSRPAIRSALLFCITLAAPSGRTMLAQATAPKAPMQPTFPPQVAPAPPSAVQPVSLPAEPQSQPLTVEQLIARAEAEYVRGQANYSAGHLAAAKECFDSAFNILLGSPYSVTGDERLQQEFEHIVEAIHELELQAIRVGDGFTEQRSEPAPIDEANSITFPVDPTIKAKAQAELANTRSDLPLMLTDPVAAYINYFSSRGHSTIERALIRRGRYAEMISRIFHEEGVPQDLVFLAQAESGFQPMALSRMGARGMWQFMPRDGLDAGLRRNWWIDERQDPEKATRAAARLLRDLFNQFGDWYLAMAAYNSGPGTVQHAVQRTGYADFWELYKRSVLPGETRNYVPIILAMTIMAKNPAQYGLDHLELDPPLVSDTVRIHYPIDLRLVAEVVDSSTSTLQELNPSLLRMTTPREMDFDLHLPKGTAARFQQTIAAIPEEMRVYWRYHRVERGESLAEIARRYHVSAAAIAEANDLEDGARLEPESRLIIPVPPAKAAPARATAFSKHPLHYTVHKGDTVSSVADSFGVPPEKVRQWNHLKGDSLAAGHALTIYKPVAGTGASAPAVQHGKAAAKPAAHTHPAKARHKAPNRAAAAHAPAKHATPTKKHKQQS